MRTSISSVTERLEPWTENWRKVYFSRSMAVLVSLRGGSCSSRSLLVLRLRTDRRSDRSRQSRYSRSVRSRCCPSERTLPGRSVDSSFEFCRYAVTDKSSVYCSAVDMPRRKRIEELGDIERLTERYSWSDRLDTNFIVPVCITSKCAPWTKICKPPLEKREDRFFMLDETHSRQPENRGSRMPIGDDGIRSTLEMGGIDLPRLVVHFHA